MGIYLGLDGKRRAVDINKGSSVATITTLYVGLLQSAPANMDGMDLVTLVNAGQANEFSINANFYTGRKAITIGATSADANGAVAYNNNIATIEWTNTSGSAIDVPAFFITDIISGTSGQVLWVGVPDAGTSTIANLAKASIYTDDLMIKVD